MTRFFVYTCQRCGAAYPGRLEITENRRNQKETVGLCVACLESLVHLDLPDPWVEQSDSASKGDARRGE